MGGNVFKNLNIERVHKDDISTVCQNMVNDLQFPNLTSEYISSNLMGSTGKKETNGDIDIALDCNLFNDTDFGKLFEKATKLYGEHRVRFSQKNSFLSIAYPFTNNSDIQVDFLYGNATWLKFTHHSPSENESDWKGVFVSQCMGVSAKFKPLFVYPENAIVDKDNNIDERIADVSYKYNLEKGLYISARLWNKKKNHLGPVTLDELETHCPVVPPRFPRIGYISDPSTVLKMIFKEDLTPNDVSTFEKILTVCRRCFADDWGYFKERLTTSLCKSSAVKETTREEIEEFLKKYD